MNDENTTSEYADQRARFVAGLREFATWLEERPWVPVTQLNGYQHLARLQIDLHGSDGLAEVRTIGDRLGVKVKERLDDRTSIDATVGSVSYSVIAWHPNGRPGEREAELEKLRAENAELRAAIGQSVWCGGDCTLVADHPGECEPRDETGFGYSREAEDNPAPVSPARVPLHTGSVVDGDALVVDDVDRTDQDKPRVISGDTADEQMAAAYARYDADELPAADCSHRDDPGHDDQTHADECLPAHARNLAAADSYS